MKDEFSELKRVVEWAFKSRLDGTIRSLPCPLRELIGVFCMMGEKLKERGDRKELHSYYGRFAPFFRAYLEGKLGTAAAMNEACAFYDLLYGLKWRSIADQRDLDSFNSEVVDPFVAFVRSLPWGDCPENRTQSSGRSPARLAYLATWCSLVGANAVPRVTWTMILGHIALRRARGDQGKVIVYCTLPPAPDLVAAAQAASVELRAMWKGGDEMATARAILQAAEEDGVDALVLDTASAVATVLAVKRAAPVQIHLEMGFDVWRVPNIDFCFQCTSVRWAHLVATADRAARLPLVNHIEFLAFPRGTAEVEAMRAPLLALPLAGAGARVVFGFYGRMSKVTLPWLRLLERILKSHPRAVGYIGGGGGQNAVVDGFLKHSSVAGRILYQPRYVDGHVVGRVLDVFLDTFPFSSGISSLESQAKGVPVVWFPGGIEEAAAERMEVYRDPALAAEDENDYVRLAVALTNPEKRAAASVAARALVAKHAHGEGNAAQVEQVIQHFLAPVPVNLLAEVPI